MASWPKSFSCLVFGIAATLALSSCASLPQGPSKSGSASDGGGQVAVAGDIAHEEVLAGLSDENAEYLLEPSEATWDVTYNSDVEVVSGGGLDALFSADQGSGEDVFDRAAARGADICLHKGEMLLLAGHSLVRIVDVRESGVQVNVSTEPASLDDAIHDGAVAWDVPVSFDFDQLFTSIEPGGGGDTLSMETAALTVEPQLTGIGLAMPDGSVVPVVDGEDIAEAVYDSISVDKENGSVDWTFSSGPNKYQFRLTSKGDSVDILIVVSRYQGSEATLAYRAEGTIGSVRSTALANYSNGELQNSDVNLDNLAVDLDLSIAAAGAGVGSLRTEIPIPFMKFSWLVGPVPVTLDIKASITGAINAQADASATAEASFAYRGGVGVSFEGASLSAAGETISAGIDPQPADSASSMGINVDAQYGVAFPEVSLSMFGQGLVPYIRPGFLLGSSLTWGDPAAGFPASSLCKEAYVRTEVAIGYDFKVLGKSLASGEDNLYEDRKDARAESCPEADE